MSLRGTQKTSSLGGREKNTEGRIPVNPESTRVDVRKRDEDGYVKIS